MKRYLFRDAAQRWCVADSEGIAVGNTSILGDICALDFNTAINLSRDYFGRADDAAARGDLDGEERWSTWGEQLEIWASRSYPAPGRALKVAPSCGSERSVIQIRRRAIHDEQAVSFEEMTRRDPACAGGGR